MSSSKGFSYKLSEPNMLSAISDSDAKLSESNGFPDPVANGSVGAESNGSVESEPNGSKGFEPNGSSEPDVSDPNISSSNSDLNGSS